MEDEEVYSPSVVGSRLNLFILWPQQLYYIGVGTGGGGGGHWGHVPPNILCH